MLYHSSALEFIIERYISIVYYYYYYINIAFHNYKIKCTQNKTGVSHSKMATLNYKVQNCKCTRMKYLGH